SEQGAMPSRLLVPLSACAASFRCRLIPFSFCKLPTGTTIEELVISGRSVSIGVLGSGQSPATAVDSKAARDPPTSAINASTRIKTLTTGIASFLLFRFRAANTIPRRGHLFLETARDWRRQSDRICGELLEARAVYHSYLARQDVSGRASHLCTRSRGVQSICAPDALMIGAHLASSALTTSAVVSGVLPG